MLSFASLFLPLCSSRRRRFAPLTESAALDSPHRHVRTTDQVGPPAAEARLPPSRTFADLMARLEHSDVIVYIEEVPRLPADSRDG